MVRKPRRALVTPFDLQPAVAGILCVILAGLHVAGSVAVLRILSVCGHNLDRLSELETLEHRLKSSEAKLEARK
jgi:hypothetical protein